LPPTALHDSSRKSAQARSAPILRTRNDIHIRYAAHAPTQGRRVGAIENREFVCAPDCKFLARWFCKSPAATHGAALAVGSPSKGWLGSRAPGELSSRARECPRRDLLHYITPFGVM
jgi:hypothetical protein